MSWLRARDYSAYQGDVDFSKEPIDIALIKMSGGDAGLYMDSKAAINYQRAVSAGKGVMGWHFLGADIDPVTQADYAVKAMMPFAENDVYGVDFEIQVADPVNFVLAYEKEFHAKTGCYAIPYINGSTINAYDWSPVFDLVLPWVAWWGVSPDANVPIKYPYIIQQYDNSGTIVSNGARVDEDAVFLTLEEFDKYGYHATNPQPAPQPTTTTTTEAPVPTTTTTTEVQPSPSTTTTTTETTVNPPNPPSPQGTTPPTTTSTTTGQPYQLTFWEKVDKFIMDIIKGLFGRS